MESFNLQEQRAAEAEWELDEYLGEAGAVRYEELREQYREGAMESAHVTRNLNHKDELWELSLMTERLDKKEDLFLKQATSKLTPIIQRQIASGELNFFNEWTFGDASFNYEDPKGELGAMSRIYLLSAGVAIGVYKSEDVEATKQQVYIPLDVETLGILENKYQDFIAKRDSFQDSE